MSERIRSLLTYIFVIFLLLAFLAIISPTQFQILIDLFSQSGELILVLIVIAIIVLLFKKFEEI